MSVSVLPASPSALGGFGSSYPSSSSSSSPAMQNGVPRSYDDMTAAQIKDMAKRQAQTASRNASALSLISAARTQILTARTHENNADFKSAYSAYIKGVSLVQLFMDSAEFKAEMQPGKRGVLFKEYQDLQMNEGRDLSQRVVNVETKLKELEASAAQSQDDADEDDGPIVASGGSIADRMRALKNAGMSVNTTKRLSRDLPKAPTAPPMSPSTTRLENRDSAHSLRSSAAAAAAAQPPPSVHPLSPPPLQTSSFSTASSSSHAFVPTSALGPPSPTSSSGSSPKTSQFTLSEFSQAFPSIDELEEMSGQQADNALRPALSGSMNGVNGAMNGLSISTSSRPILPQPLAASSSISSMDEHIPSPSVAARQFPVLPNHTGSSMSGLRRASVAATPPTPLNLPDGNTGSSGHNSPVSRPSSPWSNRPPNSPSVPRKPSNLSLHSSAPTHPSPIPQPLPTSISALPPSTIISSASDSITPQTMPTPPQPDKPDLPVMNSIAPRQLHDYMQNQALKVLLVDVRTREEFERDYIKHPGDCVVCLEPSVLARGNVTAESIEDSLSVAPSIEHTLFSNRDKFDLVVMYDECSDSYSPLFQALSRAIYETAFRKMLKRMPVLLIGGLQAWKQEFGDAEIGHGSPDNLGEVSHRGRPHRHSEQKERRGHGVNGTASISHTGGRHLPGADAPSLASAAYRNRSQTESATSAPRMPSIPRSDGMRFTPDQMASAGSSRTSVPPLSRKPPMSPPTQYPAPQSINNVVAPLAQTWSSASGSIQYPSFTRSMSPSITRTSSPSVSTSSFHATGAHAGLVSPPPQASINPSPLSRRRSDYIDQSQEALSNSGLGIRAPIDYPDLSARHVIQPPPPVAAPSERQDSRALMHLPAALIGPRPPTIQSEYPVLYWKDASIATSGLKNMGNTCYMNSTIQCLNATVPFARFFLEGHWQKAVNMLNPLGTKGQLAAAFASILHDMWKQDQTFLVPTTFRRAIVTHATQFEGTEQQDCQEFLSFLLGGLHEDLNRILKKPNYTPTPEREAELERLPVQIASEQEWSIYRMRDDSLIVDFFQGQFRNRMQCMTCKNTSTTYNAFMYLTLPIPTKSSKVSLYQCLDTFVQHEVMEKSDAWHCPHCKTLRSATKQLSLSRLPPVLLIHLKRFSSKGAGADKIESFVDFPLKNLDLTPYMPAALPPGIDRGVPGAQQLSMDDPRNQSPPYKYDLYGVTNHFGSLTSGHYTAFIANRGGWMYADDSRLTPADPKDVVGKPAYVLYYKRVKA